MRLINLTFLLAAIFVAVSPTFAVTLTFDDIPQGLDIRFYGNTYGVNFSSELNVLNHNGSTWGPPHSGNNVLGALTNPQVGYSFMGFKKIVNPNMPSQSFYVYSIGGYFSTEPGIVLEMNYHVGSAYGGEVMSTVIGSPGESWNNVYVQISSPLGIGGVTFTPVTTDALLHWSVDDMTIVPVPEPASLLALGVGLAGLALRKRRR